MARGNPQTKSPNLGRGVEDLRAGRARKLPAVSLVIVALALTPPSSAEAGDSFSQAGDSFSPENASFDDLGDAFAEHCDLFGELVTPSARLGTHLAIVETRLSMLGNPSPKRGIRSERFGTRWVIFSGRTACE